MMNQANAMTMAQGFLKGTFDVVDAMLGVTSSFQPPEIRAVAGDEAANLTREFAFVTHAKIKSGGAVALMLTVQDAARLASLVLSGAAVAKDALDDSDISSLKEIVDPCMGGGVSNLQEKYGVEVELTDLQVTGEGAVDLGARMGGALTAAMFGYSIPPDVEGRGVLILADSLERLVPGVQLPSEAPGKRTGGSTATGKQHEHANRIRQQTSRTTAYQHGHDPRHSSDGDRTTGPNRDAYIRHSVSGTGVHFRSGPRRGRPH